MLVTVLTIKSEGGFCSRFNLTLATPRSKEINYAMNNSFGFSGHILIDIFKPLSFIIEE